MPIYKDEEKNTWMVKLRYRDWNGEWKSTTKRGFATKKDAKDYELSFHTIQHSSIEDTKFEDFVDTYLTTMSPRIRETTMYGKEHLFSEKITPYFKNMKIKDIKPVDVLRWQQEILKSGVKPTYAKTIHNQLSALFNFGIRYYGLQTNPARNAGNMGTEKYEEMKFWTREEYEKFSNAIVNKEMYYHAFQMLYWCGLRCGELLALTPKDFDFERHTVRIDKSFTHLNGKDYINDPKTRKGIRTVSLPNFLNDEIENYIKRHYDLKPNDRIFPTNKQSLRNTMESGSKKAGVKKIRIHDLRHSHVSLLIEMGYSAVDIANRVGHESIRITYRYAHMFPSKDVQIANGLDDIKGGKLDVSEKFGSTRKI